MKKIISLILTLVCLLSVTAGMARADGESWYCDNCYQFRDSDYCPTCGARKPSGENGWPEMELTGIGTGLKPLKEESKRHQSFFGPNRNNYGGAGAYKPYKVISATALLREGDYVLVDLEYKTVGRRCVYFKAESLTNASLQEAHLTATQAVVNGTVQPHFGPGNEYDAVVNKITNPVTGNITTNKVEIGAGTGVSVFFETRGWVFAEFNCELGLIRAWLPVNMLRV